MDDLEGWGIDERLDERKVRRAFCRQAAAQLLKRNGVTTPPVDVEQIAGQLGLELRRTRLPHGVSARLTLSEERNVIEIAEREASVRQRFSIGHELGHLSLGHAHGEGKVAETEADIFSGALLMPPGWLKKDLPNFPTAAALAERYDVSRDAMFIALKDARLLGRVR